MPFAPIVIVGSGLAGYTLAREIRNLDAATPVVVVSRNGAEFHLAPTGAGAAKSPGEMAEELGIQVMPFTTVVDIDPAGGFVWLSDGRPLAYRNLVLAWGTEPAGPPLAGRGAPDVLSIGSLEDLERCSHRLASAGRVAILGAGPVGCEVANALASRDIETMVIDPAEWPLSRWLPAAAGQYLAGALDRSGVQFRWRVGAQAVDRVGGTYCIALSDNTRVGAGLVLSTRDRRPRTETAAFSGIACNRGILVDRHLEASKANIHALGDCAEVAGLIRPFAPPVLLQARALARTLTGNPTEVACPAQPLMVRTPACPMAVCPPPARSVGEWRVEPGDAGLEAAFRNPSGELLGFALLGAAVSRRQILALQVPPLLF